MRVKQNVDIWSFGCILMEAAVWLIHGYPGLKTFRLNREDAIKAIPEMKNGDRFHDGTNVLPVVLQTIDGLKNDIRKSDKVTEDILENLVRNMLDEPKVRYTATQAHVHARRILRRPSMVESPVASHDPRTAESLRTVATVVRPTQISGSDNGRPAQKPRTTVPSSVEESTATSSHASAVDAEAQLAQNTQNRNISNLNIPLQNFPNAERRSSVTSPTLVGQPLSSTVSNSTTRSTSYVRPKPKPIQPGQQELPKLDVDVAERWIRDKKAGRVRTLPGDYLLDRLATRDHVGTCLSLCFQPLTGE